MQKILIISNVFPLENNQSRGCYILSQAKLLKSNGFDVRILNPLPLIPKFYTKFNQRFIGTNKVEPERTVEGIKVFHPRYIRFPRDLFAKINLIPRKSILTKTSTWLYDWNPEIVHLHGIHPLLNTGVKISKKYKSKLFITVHGWDFDIGIFNKNIKKTVKAHANKIDGICVVNKIHLLTAKEFFKEEQINLIPCHFDIEKKNMKNINNFDYDANKIKILFPADPSRKEKNYKLFNQTIRELRKRGWAIETKHLENISREKIIEKFHWADLILLTSDREGGPLVTKEAIFCGARVVSTSVGDTMEWLPSNSISLEKNPSSLATCVENALKNKYDVWKIPKKYEKEDVLKKLVELYHIN